MKPYQIIFKKECKTKTYQKELDIDTENNNTFENRNKLYTTQWRTIYEIIEDDYLKESSIFPDNLKRNVNIMKMKLLIYQWR